MDNYYHEQVTLEKKLPAMIAVLNKNEIQKFFPHDVFVPTHWHRCLEICLLENAEVILQIGNQEYLIDDDFTCINSGVVHSLRARHIKENPHCLIVLISYDFMKTYYPDIDEVFFDLSLKENHDDLKKLYRRLEMLYLQQDQYTYLDINACLFEIFALLLREYKVNKQDIKRKSNKNQDQIKAILTHLHNHYQEPLTLNDMADSFYMSKEHFSRQFHYYVGQTFRDYLAHYRLYKAYEDIIHSDMAIQDIARIHGFSNVKSLIKLFHETYHQTPLQFRKKMSRN
ncbi:helix-turn-helix transcriptional regulator [Longibaculum muris]|uniref:helix-turn-helix transcriptional regulator n=1 Tax=Longibaculum muris TaxID=1796628 RepID=UPI00189DE8A6|nr:helix-turn-helix transcriptional regulator [Longibaculum muris]